MFATSDACGLSHPLSLYMGGNALLEDSELERRAFGQNEGQEVPGKFTWGCGVSYLKGDTSGAGEEEEERIRLVKYFCSTGNEERHGATAIN